MQRTAMREMMAWKESPRRKPLVVNGARQVGKTWLVTEFGRQNFAHLAYVDFLDNGQMQDAFARSTDVGRLLTAIGAVTGTTPSAGDTLVFLDEIQECPRAITALKLFCEERPDVPVVAAGSLLGVALNRSTAPGGQPASWPVGKVDFLDMHPMTFTEFVSEVGNAQLCEVLESRDATLMDMMAETLCELLRQYLFVGGMPEAVQTFIDTDDFAAVRAVHTSLLQSYELDFAKHTATAADAERVRQTWRSVPTQLARQVDLRRFTFASIRSGARGRDYRDAVAWLADAGIVTRVPRVAKPGIPLAGYEDGQHFKLYLHDVGLLGAATDLSARDIVDGNRLFTEYKGVYAEQYVCQQLVARGCVPRYWSADGKQVKGEVDFVLERDGMVLPVEVKAERNVTGSSLSAFCRRYGVDRAVRLSLRGWADQGWMVNVPLYAANLLPDDLPEGFSGA